MGAEAERTNLIPRALVGEVRLEAEGVVQHTGERAHLDNQP